MIFSGVKHLKNFVVIVVVHFQSHVRGKEKSGLHKSDGCEKLISKLTNSQFITLWLSQFQECSSPGTLVVHLSSKLCTKVEY